MSALAVAERMSADMRVASRGGEATRSRPVAAARLRTVDLSLESLSAGWRGALDAADRALQAASHELPSSELAELGKRLRDERVSTAHILETVARAKGNSDPFVHLILPRSQLKPLLGLPTDVAGCLFDLDGLLVGGAAAHAFAWTEAFDELLEEWPLRHGESLAPFNPRTDYPLHMHGKPRLVGIRGFLASRGIRLPEGSADDVPGTLSVHGLANRKQEVLLGYLDEHGMTAFADARHYLALTGEAGMRSAVVSASVNTKTMLNRAGLAREIDVVLDGNTFVNLNMRPKLSPDSLLAACEQLGIEPRRAAVFETTAAGVIAARSAGVELIVAIDRSARAEALRADGANLLVGEVGDLLRIGSTGDRTLTGRRRRSDVMPPSTPVRRPGSGRRWVSSALLRTRPTNRA